jgi:hypothetical protein
MFKDNFDSELPPEDNGRKRGYNNGKLNTRCVLKLLNSD